MLGVLLNNPVSAEEERVWPITELYSDIDSRVRLAIKTDAASCEAWVCEDRQQFDQRVVTLGQALTHAAIQAFPEREARLRRFEFSVVEKGEAGIASNAKGRVMVFRGLQDMQLSDDALAFIMAREMGHVLAGHHRTNTSTKLIISALASVIFPVATVITASGTAAQASTATTLITSAASTATSVIGGEVAVSSMKSTQLGEAGELAIEIMQHGDWDMHSANNVLLHDVSQLTAWRQDLESSRKQLEDYLVLEEAAQSTLSAQHQDAMQMHYASGR